MGWRGPKKRHEDDNALRDVDQALADLSQTHADSDQTASDRDATASEEDRGSALRDQASADSDQRASDADQASSDRDLASGDTTQACREEHEESRDEREHATRQREGTAHARTSSEFDRISAEAARFETSAMRDDVAAERDRVAEIRDGAASRAEAVLLAADPHNANLRGAIAANAELRDAARVDRRRAAADRGQAAEDRLAAAAAQRQARIDIQSAQIDDSSGVYARQIGFAALRGEIDRCNRLDDPFVLAYVAVGGPTARPSRDALIESVIRSLRQNLRSYDLVVRVGDDEFVCGLSRTEPESAHERVDEIRKAVREGHPPGTIDVGFAVLDANDTLQTLVSRAHADMKLQ